jgi:hypothetical protein
MVRYEVQWSITQHTRTKHMKFTGDRLVTMTDKNNRNIEKYNGTGSEVR